MAATKITSESRIVGMPSVWQARFTGCWWLEEYCAIHCSLVRLPSMAEIIHPGGRVCTDAVPESQACLADWRLAVAFCAVRDALNSMVDCRLPPISSRRQVHVQDPMRSYS